jgi:RpiR family carbohydrate utilization transcriptional regulator
MAVVLTKHDSEVDATDLRTLIERISADLSPALLAVADYVLDQGPNLVFRSVDEIAMASHVSKATVVRFSRALGYDGLRSFKQALISDRLSSETSRNPQAELGATSEQKRAIDLDDGAEVLQALANSLVATGRTLNAATFEQVVCLMAKARQLVWYGTGDSGYLAMSGHHRCQINGLNSKASYYPEDMRSAARQLSVDDVVICISRSGRTTSMLAPIRAVKTQSPSSLVVITGDPGSPLAHLADFTLVSASIDLYVGQQRTTLQTTQMSIVDALTSALLAKRFDTIRSTGY